MQTKPFLRDVVENYTQLPAINHVIRLEKHAFQNTIAKMLFYALLFLSRDHHCFYYFDSNTIDIDITIAINLSNLFVNQWVSKQSQTPVLESP